MGTDSFDSPLHQFIIPVAISSSLCSFFSNLPGQFGAEVGRDDGRRGLHGAEAEVVARAGDRHAHQVAVRVHRAHHRRHDGAEHVGVAVGGRRHLLRVQQVDAGVGAEREVVVLACKWEGGGGGGNKKVKGEVERTSTRNKTNPYRCKLRDTAHYAPLSLTHRSRSPP